MKKTLVLLFFLLFVIPAAAQSDLSEIDPILIDEPNEKVFQCGEFLFLELPEPVHTAYSYLGQHAEERFLFFKTELLFLEKTGWNALDKNSFQLEHTGSDGSVNTYSLNYVMTTAASLDYGWKSLSAPLNHTSLLKYILVFDGPFVLRGNWKLIFQPAERGGERYCSIEIPLKIQQEDL